MDWLTDRLNRLEGKVHEQNRPWYRRASDIFALLAIIVAALSVIIALWSQREQSAGEERRHLSAIFNEIGSVNVEMARLLALPVPDHQKEFAGYALRNQLWTLLQDADRLATTFGDKLSAMERAVLAANFAQIEDLDRAESYLSGLLETEESQESKVSKFQKAVGYRSLANLLILKGRGHFKEAHKNYENAIEALEGLNTVSAERERANIHLMQARLYIAEHRLDYAQESLKKVWQTILQLPCIEAVVPIVNATRRYFSIVGGQEPSGHSDTCVFIDGQNLYDRLDKFQGKFELSNGTTMETAVVGNELEVQLANQRHQLTRLREGIFEFRDAQGFLVVFWASQTGRYDTLSVYQPNGVFPAHRIESN